MAKFIVNKRGAVHSIPDERAIPAGAREATAEEIARWYEMQGLKPEVNNGADKHGKPDQSGARPDRRSGGRRTNVQ